MKRYAREKFIQMDADGDGFLTVYDIEREMEHHRNEVILKTVNDLKAAGGSQ